MGREARLRQKRVKVSNYNEIGADVAKALLATITLMALIGLVLGQ